MLNETKFYNDSEEICDVKDVNVISNQDTNPLALNYNNSLDINEYWKLNRKDRTESNADMLNQSFGTKTETNTTPIEDNKEMQNEASKIQISPIPSVQKTDIEKNPASLNTGIVNSIDLDNTNVVDNNSNLINPIVNNDFNLNKGINTFDIPENNPKAFGLENIENSFDNGEKTTDIEKNELVVNNEFNLNKGINTFDIPENNPKAFGLENIENSFDNSEKTTDIEKNDLDELKEKEFALIEKEIKNQEELIEIKRDIVNIRRKIILLESQKKQNDNDINLENTASDLFDNNGVLDEERVLGETPMPTSRAA